MNENNSSGVIRTAHGEKADVSSARPSKLSHNYLAKILCIVAAFVLWLYVMQVESPEFEHVVESVPVSLENASVLRDESGLSVYAGSGNKINVTVAGKKSIVTKLTADDISAYIDLSKVKDAGRHSLEVSVELPEDVTLVEDSLPNVTVYVDEKESISLPVSEKLVNFVLESPYELGEIDFEFDTVNVTGPKNRISNLAGALVTINMENRKSSFVTSADITLIDKMGNLSDMNYLSMSESEMNVTVPIYITKEVPVEVRFKHGLVDPSLVSVTCEPPSFTLKGDAAKFSDGVSVLEKIEIDETTILSTPYTETREVAVRDGITVSAESTEVKITIDYDVSVKTRLMAVREIKVTGAHEDLNYELLSDNLLVTLRGDADQLNALNSTDISAVVDLEGFDPISSGVITRYADITFDSENTDGIFVVGTYPVQVKLNQNESQD